LGNQISLWGGITLREQFRGTVFKWTYSESDNENLQLTAYDDLYYLQASKDHRLLQETDTADAVLRAILSDWGLTIGRLDVPAVPMPKTKLQGSVGDMIAQVLGEVFYRSQGAYFLRMNYSGSVAVVDIVRPGENTTVYWFNEVNVESVQDEQDITQLVTVVKIVGEEQAPVADDPGDSESPGPIRPPIQSIVTSPLLPTFGKLQDIVQSSANDSDSVAATKAQNILDEHGNPRRVKQVVAPDVPDVFKGDIHHFACGTLYGYYIISGVQHNAETGKMNMTIDTSGTTDYQHLRVSADKLFILPDTPL
jgi:hypothetical protein